MSLNHSKHDAEEKALEEFLLDINCLDELSPWIGDFNIFDVLKVSRTEIRHSNMLGWLLDPNANHGIGDDFLRTVVQRLIENDTEERYSVFKLLLLDFYSFSVYREWKNIDLLLISEKERVVFAIENKVDSHEHSNQLNRYRSIIQKDYPQYDHYFIFLTPDGEEPSDTKNWDTFTYTDVVESLERVFEKTKVLPDVSLLIQNYISIIRRDIVDDQRLIEICNQIYAKHKVALDLIYDNRIDGASQLGGMIKKVLADLAAANKIIFEPRNNSNTFVMFYTEAMDVLLPPLESPNSSYSTNRPYGYCISLRGNTIRAYFELGGRNITDTHKTAMDKIISVYKPNDKNTETFRYKRIYSLKPVVVDEQEFSDEIIGQKIERIVSEMLAFEKDLIDNLH